MTATFIQRGDSIDHVPEEDIAAGQIVVIGDLVGIAMLDIDLEFRKGILFVRLGGTLDVNSSKPIGSYLVV